MNWTTRLPQTFIAEPQKPQAPVFENEEALKLAFAAELLKSPNNPFQAALAVIECGEDHRQAIWAATYWIHDPIVKKEKERLLNEEGELSFLPSKAQTAREIYELSNLEKLSASDKIKLEAKVAYAKLMGFMPTETAKSNVNVNASKGASVQVVASELDEKL